MTLTASQKRRRRLVSSGPVAGLATAPRNRSRRGRRRMRRRTGRFAHPYIIAKANPFEQAADGVKAPDANETPSSVFKIYDGYNIATDANGHAARAFTPMLLNTVGSPLSITAGGTITWAGGTTQDASGAGTIAPLYAAYRVVAGGIRITYTGSRDCSSGVVYVGHYPNTGSVYDLSAFATTGSAIRHLPGGNCFSVNSLVEHPVIIPFRMVDLDGLNYMDCAQGNADGMTSIVVMLNGSAISATQLIVELVLHCEGLPATEAANSGLSISPSAPYEPEVLAAGSNMDRFGGPSLRGTIKVPERPFSSRLADAFSRAARVADDLMASASSTLPMMSDPLALRDIVG